MFAVTSAALPLFTPIVQFPAAIHVAVGVRIRESMTPCAIIPSFGPCCCCCGCIASGGDDAGGVGADPDVDGDGAESDGAAGDCCGGAT